MCDGGQPLCHMAGGLGNIRFVWVPGSHQVFFFSDGRKVETAVLYQDLEPLDSYPMVKSFSPTILCIPLS
jgi:hypothetical protein